VAASACCPLSAGRDGYIAKPIEVASFAQQLRAHLRP
jgi:DNA-binding response OmpR family regulator